MKHPLGTIKEESPDLWEVGDKVITNRDIYLTHTQGWHGGEWDWLVKKGTEGKITFKEHISPRMIKYQIHFKEGYRKTSGWKPIEHPEHKTKLISNSFLYEKGSIHSNLSEFRLKVKRR